MYSADRRRRLSSGFTLLEALAAVTLLGIGIVGAMTANSQIIRTEDRARQTERLQRLAQGKLAELIATGQAATSTSGDFMDQNIQDVTWNLESNTTGITDLDSVRLTVQGPGGDNDKYQLDTLLYVPPTTTTSTTTTGTTR